MSLDERTCRLPDCASPEDGAQDGVCCEPVSGSSPLASDALARSPLASVQPLVDAARRLTMEVGAEPYRVALIWMRRDARQTFQEFKRVDLVPARVVIGSSLLVDRSRFGANLEGPIKVTGISPRLVDEHLLLGRINGVPPAEDVTFFYEVRAAGLCDDGSPAGRRWKFVPSSLPRRMSTCWELDLADAEVPRTDGGADRQLPSPTAAPPRRVVDLLR